MGGATIAPRSIKTKENKQNFKIGQIFLIFFKSLMNPLYLLKIVFFQIF
jgi:hypothetical protein